MVDVAEFDVIIVGAGLSGIGAAYHLQTECPRKTFAILEARASLGGTWDLFRYPGIRSDSDMHTLGYSFRPWTEEKSIAPGGAILSYLEDTARAYGIDRKIRFGQRLTAARWSSESARWELEVQDAASGAVQRYRCAFLLGCTGYYDYEQGYTPQFAGKERFQGLVIHPQHWPSDLDYTGKRVVVIGSGATAVTLVPALAERAAHVTMLQRSPTYVLSLPERDALAEWLKESLPEGPAHALIRWKNIAFGSAFYSFCRKFPERARGFLLEQVRRQLKEPAEVDAHFSPSYAPWDQRVCFVPDGDLFKVLRRGQASVVTDHIETFTEKGLRLRSGRELEADIIVTATGLALKFFGGVRVEVDGRPVELPKTTIYRGMMCSDVPNLAFVLGYTNASWTLKADLICRYVCRLLNYMDEKHYTHCVPRRTDPRVQDEPLLDFTSGYVQRALPLLPRQGSVAPWKLYQNYVLDRITLKHTRLEDGSLQFASAERR